MTQVGSQHSNFDARRGRNGSRPCQVTNTGPVTAGSRSARRAVRAWRKCLTAGSITAALSGRVRAVLLLDGRSYPDGGVVRSRRRVGGRPARPGPRSCERLEPGCSSAEPGPPAGSWPVPPGWPQCGGRLRPGGVGRLPALHAPPHDHRHISHERTFVAAAPERRARSTRSVRCDWRTQGDPRSTRSAAIRAVTVG